MVTITTINANDKVGDSRTDLNNNFSNLNSGKLENSNNLSDVADAATSRTNLGLGDLATQNTVDTTQITDINLGTISAIDLDTSTADRPLLVARKRAGDSNEVELSPANITEEVLGGMIETSILSGAVLSINAGDAQTYDITGSTGSAIGNYLFFEDAFADPVNPTISGLTFSDLTAIKPEAIRLGIGITAQGTPNTESYIAISLTNTGLPSNVRLNPTTISGTINGSAGTAYILEKEVPFTDEEKLDYCPLGRVVHFGIIDGTPNTGTIINFATTNSRALINKPQTLYGVLERITPWRDGGYGISAFNATQISINGGTALVVNVNSLKTEANRRDPSVINTPQIDAPTFFQAEIDATGNLIFSTATTVDVTNYNPIDVSGNGSIATISNNRYVIYDFYLFPDTLNVATLRPQQFFSSFNDALAAGRGLSPNLTDATAAQIDTELANSLRAGRLIIREGEDLTNASFAFFLQGQTNIPDFGNSANSGSSGGGGEVNTLVNGGVGGVGLPLPKTGTQLNIKSINSGSSKVTVTDDVANSEIDIDTPFALQSNPAGEPTGSDAMLNSVSLTQAEYDAGTKISTTLYIITDAT